MRGGSAFGKADDYSHMSPTDREFDQKMEFQVQALDNDRTDTQSNRKLIALLTIGIAEVLESIDHSKYLPFFIEHEIDYETFLSLEDGDLKELGIKALGSRKKILAVIRESKVEKVETSGKSFDF